MLIQTQIIIMPNLYLNIYTPYIDTDKFGILKDGMDCLGKLNLDFNEVYYIQVSYLDISP